MALPGQAAVGIAGFKASDALEAGRRIWGAARQQLLRPGLGVDPAVVARARNTGTAGYNAADGVLTLDGDLVDDDLQAGSLVDIAVTAAAGGRRLKLCLVGSALAEPQSRGIVFAPLEMPPQMSARPEPTPSGEQPSRESD